MGRADDVIKSAGHLIGPFEVESALMEHPAVAEAGVIGKPDPVVGETVKAFVSLKAGYAPSDDLGLELLGHARTRLGAAVAPKEIERTGVEVGVIVTDSFGRPWRAATTDVAIGAAGVTVVRDLAGERDPAGYELHATRIAVGDEIAGAAQLVFGKLDRVPVAVVRGLDARGEGRAADLVIPPETDLFR